ncbi:MAG TPA: glycosyltransferase family 2 protein [Ktedonobacteraceae bacterium]
MEITVIIPSSNRAQLLEKTLDSLSRQTRSDFRVLVVDHGSTDETRAVCGRKENALHLKYFRLEKDRNGPGIPRHYAMQRVETPLAAFLDCGVVVPTFYVQAHLAFHQQHPHYVGIGLYHGYRPFGEQDERWSELLKQVAIDEAPGIVQEQPDLADERRRFDPDGKNFMWMYGWTGNLSLPVEDYQAAGGFDLHLEYAFEDIDLSYRLFKQGSQFGFVENGWGIHLPHAQPPRRFLRKVRNFGWEQSYRKLRTLGLEIMYYTTLNGRYAEQTLAYLLSLKRALATLPSTASLVTRYDFARPSLLLGGTLQDASFYDYLALGDEQIESTATLWSCCGLRIPLDDQSLQSVVVTDIWKWLNCAFNKGSLTMLEFMLAELTRTTHKVFFIDSPGQLLPGAPSCSLTQLELLCRRYELEFQIIVPE